MSLEEDFKVDVEAHVSPKRTLEFRRRHQSSLVANKILSASAHVSILRRFKFRAEAHVNPGLDLNVDVATEDPRWALV